MKILAIDDNPVLSARIKESLKKWAIVEVASTGGAGAKLGEDPSFDLILLDLKLPDMGGLAVCKQIREVNPDVPILVLTGDASTDSQVELLDSGADDYMTKPFSMDELRARINSLARRRKRSEHELSINVGDLQIDPTKRTASRAGVEITLRRKEFDILEYLAKNQGRILSRQNILDHAWLSTSTRWPGSVDVHVKKLRDAIDKPFNVSSIKTTYGIGYSIEAVHTSKTAIELASGGDDMSA